MMAEKAGSTVSLDANYDAIQNHVNGMSIADAEALSKDEKGCGRRFPVPRCRMVVDAAGKKK